MACAFTIKKTGEDSILYQELLKEYGEEKAFKVMTALQSPFIESLVVGQSTLEEYTETPDEATGDKFRDIPKYNSQQEPSFAYVKEFVNKQFDAVMKSVMELANKEIAIATPTRLPSQEFYTASETKSVFTDKLKKTYEALQGQKVFLEKLFGERKAKQQKLRITKQIKELSKIKAAENKKKYLETTLEKGIETDDKKIQNIKNKIDSLTAEIKNLDAEKVYTEFLVAGNEQLVKYRDYFRTLKAKGVTVTDVKVVKELNSTLQFVKEVEDTYKLLLLEDKDRIADDKIVDLHTKLSSNISDTASIRISLMNDLFDSMLKLHSANPELAKQYFDETNVSPDLNSLKDRTGIMSVLGNVMERYVGDTGSSSDVLVATLDKMRQFEHLRMGEEFRNFEQELNKRKKEFEDYQKSQGVNVNNVKELYAPFLQRDSNGQITDSLIGQATPEYQAKRAELEANAFEENGQEKDIQGIEAYTKWIVESHDGVKEALEELNAKRASLDEDAFDLYFEENFSRYFVRDASGKIKDFTVPQLHKLQPKQQFLDKQYQELQKLPDDNPVKAYFDYWREAYNEFGAYVPSELFNNGAVLLGIRQTIFEKAAVNGNIWGTIANIPKNISRYFSYDGLYLGKELLKADGTVKKFPILKGIGKLDVKDKSFDMTNVLKVMAASVMQYRNQTTMMSTMENALDVIANKEFFELDSGGNPIVDKRTGLPKKKHGANSRVFNALADSIAIHVYGEDKIPQDQKDKWFKAIGKFTSLTTMSFNAVSFAPNMLVGRTTNWIEAVGGEFFNVKNYARATKEYNKELFSTRMFKQDELGNAKSKLAAVLENNNLIQDSADFAKMEKSENDTLIKKLFNWSNFFILQKIGDHTHQATAALAYMYNKQVVDKRDGQTKSFYDTIGYTNGKVTYNADMSEEALLSFLNSTRGVVQALHGNYASNDAVPLQRTTVGQLALAFRKWIKPSMDSRFRAGALNKETGLHNAWWDEKIGKDRKGRFVTLSDLARLLIKNRSLSKAWGAMTELDKINMRKNAVELSIFASTLLAYTILGAMADDDDELRDYKAFNYAQYVTQRLNAEYGFYVPGVNLVEAQRFLTSPFAATSTLNKSLRLINELGAGTYNVTTGEPFFREFERGPNKGKYKLGKYVTDLTPLRGFGQFDKFEDEVEFGVARY